MFCIYCGNPSPADATLCFRCGGELPFSPEISQAPAALLLDPPQRVPWGLGQVGLGMMLVVAGALLVSPLIVLLVGRENPALIAFLTSLGIGMVIFLAVWLAALRPYRVPLSALGLKPPGVPRLKTVGLTVGALLLSLVATAIYALLVRWAGWEILVPPEIPREIAFQGSAVVLTFLALALWTPVSEEVFFRGFIFAGLSARWGVAAGIIVSAAIFSVFHISPGVLIPIFITGLLLAWLYRQTGSLWGSIAAHAGQNAAAVAVTIYGV